MAFEKEMGEVMRATGPM